MQKKANKKIFFLIIFFLLTIIIGGAITGYFLLHSPIPAEFLRFQKQSRQINSKLCAIKKDAARKISSQKWAKTNLNCVPTNKKFLQNFGRFANFLSATPSSPPDSSNSKSEVNEFIEHFIDVLHSTKEISDNYLDLHTSTIDFTRLNSLIKDIRESLNEAESMAKNLEDMIKKLPNSPTNIVPDSSGPTSDNSEGQANITLFNNFVSQLQNYEKETKQSLLKINKKILSLEKKLASNEKRLSILEKENLELNEELEKIKADIEKKMKELKKQQQTEKDKAAKLEAVKTALNALSTQSNLITFEENWAANLDENTPVEIDFTAPAEKDLTDYKLKVSYSDEAITFEIISKMDNSQIWTSTDLESGPIEEASQIDSDLLTTIITQVENKWAKEWKKESGAIFLSLLEGTFANLDKSSLTTEINDSEDLDKEYETSFTLTKSSADGTEFEFTIKLKFRLSSSDENAKAWAKEWTITEATYTLGSDANAVATSFTFEDNSDTAAKIAKINTDLQTPADREAAAQKLQVFINKLKTWDDDLLHTTTDDSTWNELSTINPVTLQFASSKDKLSAFNLVVSYNGTNITFQIKEVDDQTEIWSSSSLTEVISHPDQITPALKKTIITEVETKWAEEWEVAEKTRIENLLKTITGIQENHNINGVRSDSGNNISYEITIEISESLLEDPISFSVTLTIGPEDADQDSKAWDSEWKILTASISGSDDASEQVDLTSGNENSITKINQKLAELQEQEKNKIIRNQFQSWSENGLSYLTIDESTFANFSENNLVEIIISDSNNQELTSYKLKVSLVNDQLNFKIFNFEDQLLSSLTSLSTLSSLNEVLSNLLTEKIELLWTTEFQNSEKDRITNLLETSLNENSNLSEITELSRNLKGENNWVVTYSFTFAFPHLTGENKVTGQVIVTLGPEDADPASKAWENPWKILTALISLPNTNEEPTTVLLSDDNSERIIIINNQIAELKNSYIDLLPQEVAKILTFLQAATFASSDRLFFYDGPLSETNTELKIEKINNQYFVSAYTQPKNNIHKIKFEIIADGQNILKFAEVKYVKIVNKKIVYEYGSDQTNNFLYIITESDWLDTSDFISISWEEQKTEINNILNTETDKTENYNFPEESLTELLDKDSPSYNPKAETAKFSFLRAKILSTFSEAKIAHNRLEMIAFEFKKKYSIAKVTVIFRKLHPSNEYVYFSFLVKNIDEEIVMKQQIKKSKKKVLWTDGKDSYFEMFIKAFDEDGRLNSYELKLPIAAGENDEENWAKLKSLLINNEKILNFQSAFLKFLTEEEQATSVKLGWKELNLAMLSTPNVRPNWNTLLFSSPNGANSLKMEFLYDEQTIQWEIPIIVTVNENELTLNLNVSFVDFPKLTKSSDGSADNVNEHNIFQTADQTALDMISSASLNDQIKFIIEHLKGFFESLQTEEN